jgi:hypothetical protein
MMIRNHSVKLMRLPSTASGSFAFGFSRRHASVFGIQSRKYGRMEPISSSVAPT